MSMVSEHLTLILQGWPFVKDKVIQPPQFATIFLGHHERANKRFPRHLMFKSPVKSAFKLTFSDAKYLTIPKPQESSTSKEPEYLCKVNIFERRIEMTKNNFHSQVAWMWSLLSQAHRNFFFAFAIVGCFHSLKNVLNFHFVSFQVKIVIEMICFCSETTIEMTGTNSKFAILKIATLRQVSEVS